MSQSMLRFAPVLISAALIAGCTSVDPRAALAPGNGNQQASAEPAVIQGACPAVTLREGTAYYTTYAKGGDGDPTKIVHQASISDTTRQCRVSGDQIIMTVVVTGRVVGGPAVKTGIVELPLRVVAVDGETVLYTELQKHPVSVAEGGPAEQFIYTNAAVTFPMSAAGTAKLYAGFDPGPVKKR